MRALGNNPFESLGSNSTDGLSGRIVDPETGEDIFTPNTDPTVVGNEDDGTPYPEGTDIGFAAPLRRYLQLGIHNGDFSRAPRDSSLPLMADEGNGYNPLPYWKYVPDTTGSIKAEWVAAAGTAGAHIYWTGQNCAANAEAYIEQMVPVSSSAGQTFFHVPIGYWICAVAPDPDPMEAFLSAQYLRSDGTTTTGTDAEVSTSFASGEFNQALETTNGGHIPGDAAWMRVRFGVRAPTAHTQTQRIKLHEVGMLVGVPSVYVVDVSLPNTYDPAELTKSSGVVTLKSNVGGSGAQLDLLDTGDARITMWDEGDTFSIQDGALRVTEIADPANPTSGVKIYSKSDNGLYARNDAGTVVNLITAAALANDAVVKTPSATQTIDNQAAAAIPLVIQGHASQSADLFVVENSAGTDLWLINADGTVEQQTTGDAHTITRFANDAYGAGLNLRKSRSGTLGTNTIVTSGDRLGAISWFGGDGTDYDLAGFIAMESDGTPGSGTDMPGRFVVYTSPDGSATPAERFRIDSSGRVGIGVTPSVSDSILSLSKGITFPATQVSSTDVNTLDDYEEGTWTPGLTFATAGNQNIVLSSAVGSYTKVGRLVTISALIVTSTFTHTTASGLLKITGLPFSPGISFPFMAAQAQGWTKANYTQIGFELGTTSETHGYLYATGSGQTGTELGTGDLPSGTQQKIWISGSYTV